MIFYYFRKDSVKQDDGSYLYFLVGATNKVLATLTESQYLKYVKQ